MAAEREVLVSVGLPTFNRIGLLPRAVESVLGQDADLELIISDNASTDGTEAYVRELARRDSRVRYHRHPTNVGLTANFRTSLALARGRFFMWLSDDDYLGPRYLSACARVVEEDDACIGAVGRVRVMDLPADGTPAGMVERMRPYLEASASERIIHYFSSVFSNTEYYAVWRRETLARVPYPNSFGNDCHVVAALLAIGKLALVDDVTFHKQFGGVSSDPRAIYRVLGITPPPIGHEWLRFGLAMAADIAWRVPAYRHLSWRERARLLVRVPDAIWTREFPMPDWWWRYIVWRQRLIGIQTGFAALRDDVR